MTSLLHRTVRPVRSTTVKAATAVTAVLALTAVTGCSVDLSGVPATLVGALVPFTACDEALAYLRAEGVDRVGPYGLGGGGFSITSGEAPASQDEAADSAPTADGGYSTTNNQEAGVDEADVVKTDGSYVYSTVDGVLRITDVRGDVPVVVGELALSSPATGENGAGIAADMLPGYGPAQLLLVGDTALVTLVEPQVWLDEVLPAPGQPYGPGTPQATLVTVDLADRTDPRETSRLSVDGTVVASRLVDGAARVVVQSAPALPFEQPMYEGVGSDDDWAAVEEAATARNREIVESSSIEDWLPSYALESPNGSSTGVLAPCDRVSRPADFAGFGSTSVLTIGLGAGAVLGEPVATSVLGSGEIVYASTDRLYVATNRWNSPAWGGVGGVMMAPTDTTTGVHAFDITVDGPAAYVGSGEVDGRIIGQYALSEHEGVLRVATTEDGEWTEGTSTSESSLTTLGERDGELVQLGRVDGLGAGEQIYSVRYVGDTAYVVTFRQTDPLYVLDLSDPSAPRVSGELKITGYSSYLHPLSGDRLVGVGQEATSEGQTVGLQVSLFDTADPSAPTKIDGEVITDAYASAEWDPHAFLYWEPTGQVVLPMSGPRRGGLLVLSVTEDGLVRDGVVRAASDERADGRADAYAVPERSLVVGDTLVTVWWGGVQTNDLASLDELGWAAFS